MGKFVQAANKGEKEIRFFSVNQSNLRPENEHLSNSFEKMVFPNYILLDLIKSATQLNIRISKIEFFQSISDDLTEEILSLLEETRNSEIVKEIEKCDLDIKSIAFFDKEDNRIELYSSGIIWLEDENNTIQLISSLLEKASV